jgi:hypothetical protein
LHVGFNFKGPPKITELQPIFNKAKDWIRYAPNCWIVWTNRSANQWADLLKPKLGPEDSVFICQLDMTNRQGWLPKWVWEWLDKSRSQFPPPPGPPSKLPPPPVG